MRIAQVAPLYESVPPKLYGGTERVVSYLTEELVRHGHEVTLFASGDSQTAAKLVPVCPKALWRDDRCRETLPHHVRQMELVFQDLSRFDVVHFHGDYLHFPLLRRQPCPSVTTLHGMLHVPDLGSLFTEYSEVPLVSISDNQRRPISGANWQATIHHGLPHDLHTFREQNGDYLAFLGRMSPEKRVDRAIEIGRAAGMKLKIAAKIYGEERTYFHETIEPLLNESREFVEFIGEVGGRDKDEFLGNAAALLFPIDWAEPFGLVMIEAMACGTPVVAWNKGSVPEVIEEGVTGFVVDSVEEAVEAVRRVQWMDRGVIRQVFETRFDAARMARDYVEVYRRLANGQPDESEARSGFVAPRTLPFHPATSDERVVRPRGPAIRSVARVY
jgi:glycosyltransferase involved in cell wall biosynthesis